MGEYVAIFRSHFHCRFGLGSKGWAGWNDRQIALEYAPRQFDRTETVTGESCLQNGHQVILDTAPDHNQSPGINRFRVLRAITSCVSAYR